VAEQLNALESFIKDLIAQKKAVDYMGEAGSGYANSAANAYAPGAYSSRANLAANAITLDDPSDGYAGVRFDLNYLLGSTVATTRDITEDLASAAIRRVGELEKTDPETAEAMRSVITSWRSRAVNSFLLNDVKSGKASADAVVRLLTIRKELRESQPGDVSSIRSGSPTAAGIAACLMESDSDYVSILEGRSDEAKKSLLACGRLIRAKLAIKTVGPLMQSADKQLAVAAERYLESEDSPEARRLLLSAHPGEAKVLGATVAFRGAKAVSEESSSVAELFASVVPGNWIESQYYLAYSISQFDDEEKKLQNEVLSSPDISGIYAYGDSVVRIYSDKALFSRQEDESRYRERTLEKEEFETLKSYLARSRVDELPPFLSCPNDCAAKELLLLSRAGGRRVYVRSENKPDFFSGLESILDDMARRPGKLKYWLAADVPGLEIIFANDRYRAESVWKSGNDLRLLIADKVKEKEINKEIRQKAREEGPEYMNTAYAEAGRRRFEHYSWRGLNGGELVTVEAAPPQNFFLPSIDDLGPPADQETWKAGAGKFELRASTDGLFKVSGGKSVKIATGSFSSPIVTASGRWAIANRFDPDDGPAKLVRVDLLTNRVTPVRNADDTSMNPVAYVASVNRFLIGLRSSDSEYDEVQNGYDDGTGTYFWLSPETGQIAPTGEADLRPIGQQRFRPLQPSTTPFEFWAAIPDREKGETTFGLYSTKSFTMRPVLRLPRIRFNSQLMWVDEAASRLYFIYEGHVLAVPFKR
jgi:hypothetical protein